MRQANDQQLAWRVQDILIGCGLTQVDFSIAGGQNLHAPQVISVYGGSPVKLIIRTLPGQTTDDFARHAQAIAYNLGVAEVRVVPSGPSLIGLELLPKPEPVRSPVAQGWVQNSLVQTLVQTTVPITIYLSDESAHEQVEAAVEDLLAAAGGHIEHRDDPVFGSWFRRMRASTGQAVHSPLAREAAALAAHAMESRLVHAQDATVTATMLQNLGPVLAALQPTKDAVIRAGALLIVKVDWIVAVHQLTPAQQLQLDHQPQLAQSPHDILSALERRAGSSTPSAEVVDGTRSRRAPMRRWLRLRRSSGSEVERSAQR